MLRFILSSFPFYSIYMMYFGFMIFNKFKVSKALYILKANYYYDETAERRAQAISQQSI